MKSLRLPLCFGLFALGLFAISIVSSIPVLPRQVATHFDATGAPNGWMSRTAYLVSFSAIALGLSVGVPLLGYAIRFFPASTLNVPHRDYWRDPDNYPRACAFLFRHTLWLSAITLLFLRSVHQTIVIAHLESPPSLSVDDLGIGIFLAVVLIWCALLLRFFFKVPRPKS